MAAELNGRRGGSRKWSAIRKRVMDRDNGRCVVCGGPGEAVDHRIPRAAGGEDTWQNLQTLCNPHHREKTLAELRTLAQMPRKRLKRPKNSEISAEKRSTDVFLGLEGTGNSPFGGPDAA